MSAAKNTVITFNKSVIDSTKVKINNVNDYSAYRTFGGSMEAFIRRENFSREEFRASFLNKHVSVSLESSGMSWVSRGMLSVFMEEYPECAEEVIMYSMSPAARCYLLSRGYYADLAIIDNLSADSSVEVRVWVAHHSSFDTLKKMRLDGSSKVRRVVYGRLGPVEALDDMLLDKDAAIRERGVCYAPMNYKGFSNMYNELSKKVFPWIVSKMQRDKLPMLLGNRNMKIARCKNILSKRMN
jgi:hypothetical protein